MDVLSDGMNAHRRGLLLAFAAATVSGFAVFLNGFGVRAWAQVSDPSTYTTLKNLVATVLLALATMVAARRRGTGAVLTRPSSGRQWAGLAAIAVLGGSVPFLLFFEGLARSSSLQAAFIHKTLVVWVAILALVLLGERVRARHLLAIGLVVAGEAVLAGGVGGIELGAGELMILAATLLWSVEVVVAKRLLASLSAPTVGLARMGGGVAILAAYTAIRGGFWELTLTSEHLLWVLITGVILTAYVGAWYAALAAAPAVDVTAVLVGGAIVTALLGSTSGSPLPSLAGLGLVAAGVGVVAFLTHPREPEPA